MATKVLPDVAVRQWVLSVPYEIRWLLASKAQVLSAVLRIFGRTVAKWYETEAKRTGTTLALFARVSIDTVARVWGPDVVGVTVNGVDTPFTREGDCVVLNFEPTTNPDGGVDGGAGGSGGSAGTGGSSGSSGAGANAADGGGDGDDGGCGCRTAGTGGSAWGVLVALVGMMWARRRR